MQVWYNWNDLIRRFINAEIIILDKKYVFIRISHDIKVDMS